MAELPEEERPPADSEILPSGFAEHLNLTEERHPERQEESKDGPLYSAEGRLKFCDESGTDVQILNPDLSCHTRGFSSASRENRADPEDQDSMEYLGRGAGKRPHGPTFADGAAQL